MTFNKRRVVKPLSGPSRGPGSETRGDVAPRGHSSRRSLPCDEFDAVMVVSVSVQLSHDIALQGVQTRLVVGLQSAHAPLQARDLLSITARCVGFLQLPLRKLPIARTFMHGWRHVATEQTDEETQCGKSRRRPAGYAHICAPRERGAGEGDDVPGIPEPEKQARGGQHDLREGVGRDCDRRHVWLTRNVSNCERRGTRGTEGTTCGGRPVIRKRAEPIDEKGEKVLACRAIV